MFCAVEEKDGGTRTEKSVEPKLCSRKPSIVITYVTGKHDIHYDTWAKRR